MFELKTVDRVWFTLLGLTLLSAAVAESPDQGFVLTLVIALTVAIKGRMIVDRFMELTHANRWLRDSMRFYFYFIPLLIVLVYLFPDALVRITTLR